MTRAASRPRRAVLVASAITAALGTSGCVLGEDEAAAPLDSVPEDLLSPTTAVATTTTTEAPDDTGFTLDLYWHVNQGEGQRALVKVSRPIAEPANAQAALAELVAGPTEAEVSEFAELGTLFPLVDELLAPRLDIVDGTATVTVADEFELRENDASKIPVAEELVCTLTTFDTVLGVTVVDSAGQIPLTNRAAETITGRAERDDYGCEETLEPTPETTTTIPSRNTTSTNGIGF